MQSVFAAEVARGKRFEFGKNWTLFLKKLNAERVDLAKRSLRSMLGVETLTGKTFLDAGSGSGLFSLAARKLGARVKSFDYDPSSVACTQALRQRFFHDDPEWVVEEGSVLDHGYLETLGQYDVVYSWGVLHHTGAMWEALGNIATLVKPGGRLFIAIYNDQGWISHYWRFIKRQYNAGSVRRALILVLHVPYFYGLVKLIQVLKGKWRPRRGMSLWHDLNDWLGGYPFEVAQPGAVIEFLLGKGFVQEKIKSCGRRHGCNEYVFQRPAHATRPEVISTVAGVGE